MDEKECRRFKPNPRHGANALSRIFFWWLWPIFVEGKKHDIEPKDLYDVLPENISETVTDALEANWLKELAEATSKGQKVSFLRPLWKTFKWQYLRNLIYIVVSHFVCQTIEPLLVGLLIWHFDDKSTSSTKEAYIYATIFVANVTAHMLLFNHTLMNLRNLGVSARVASTSLVYRKILRLSYTEKQASKGRIINLLSNDASRMELFFLFLHVLVAMPLQTILITFLLWYRVGVASLAGVILLIVLTIPLLGLSGRVIARFRRKTAMRTDDRVMLLGEIVRGIRVIKMYTWERAFERLVFMARRYEMRAIARSAYLKSFLFAVMSFSKRTPLYLTIIIYVVQGNTISAFVMFSLVQYFNVLHVLIGSLFLRSVSILSEGVAAIRRLKEFLILEEQSSYVKYLPSDKEESIVTIKDVSVGSLDNPKVDVLRDIDVNVKRNSLTAIVGPVGAGKVIRLLLKLILDELRPKKGQICVFGDVSYASQDPWLFKGTLKDNILFGEPYDQTRYEQVTKACSLLEDFKQLPHGDETIVGESGSSLSGGQCARVNLARAVYKSADVYLLDDPLSAVDGRVGKRLFENCINGLLKDKTRALITHQLQFLKQADEIVIVDKGRVEYQGSFDELQKTDELLQHLNLKDGSEKEVINTLESFDDSATVEINDAAAGEDEKEEETHKLLVAKEEALKKEREIIDAKNEMLLRKCLYWKYFTSCGSYALPVLTFLAFASAQLLNSGSDYFVAYWSKHQTVRFNNSGDSFQAEDGSGLNSETVIYIFAAFTLFIIIMSVTKTALCTNVLTKCNERIHNFVATALIGANMKFYEANDSGRILNRLSKDMGSADERLQAMLVEATEYGFVALGVVIQILIINKLSVVVIVIMGLLFYKGRTIVIKTTRDLMRLDGQSKSPMFYHINSTLEGRLTIRACQAQSIVAKRFDHLQDEHTAAAGLCQYSLIAYSTWLDCLTTLFMTLLIYSFLFLRNEGSSGADVGLAITQLITLTGILSRSIKLTGDIETQMVSIERLFQYTELEQEENNKSVIGQEPPRCWPSEGKIRFDDLCLRYYQNDSVILKDLRLTIEAGEKIGIVGRTGSGKSSLIAALFRLARISGSIYIDDTDTRKIGLKYLRDKISILPQEPILFPVTLRKNLDPREEFDDASLWSGLRDVEMHKIVDSLDVAIGQMNLSTGQRQLLCLARVILKKNKIVILDEATANVDANTDALIQRTIRDKFKDCTVLTIAHRLDTIKDMDRILVMDAGRVVEFDRPEVLMQQTDGYFASMLSQVANKE